MLRLPYLVRLPSKLRRRARRSRMATLFLLFLVLVLLLAPLYIVYRPPSLVIRYLQHKWTDVLFRLWLPTSKKVVALTIDDAPSDHTRAILDALQAHAAHATFFVIGGQVAGRQDILREIVRAGHELANHGMHDEPAWKLSNDELASQIAEVHTMIAEAYRAEGREPPGELNPKRNYYRPGSGFFTGRLRSVVRKAKHHIVLGSIYPHDPNIGYWWINAKHILGMLSPGGIIICHDRRSWTPPMLNKVLPEMRKRGYKAVTVTELLAEVTG